LISFGLSQLAIIAIANVPLEKWRSFQAIAGKSATPLKKEKRAEVAPASR
jgi:hypothetical protein